MTEDLTVCPGCLYAGDLCQCEPRGPDGGPLAGGGWLQQLRAALVDSLGLDDIPDPEPLVGEDILFKDSLVWMVGKPGSMKSFTALDVAGCVGSGEHWQGYPVAGGPVLYLVAEGVRGTKKRVRAWEQAMGVKMTRVIFLPVAVQSKHGAQWDALVQLVAELRPSLVVLDTQARVTVGVEENSNTEMGGFVHQCERLREASGACVLIVHHIGRNGDTGRGATVLDGAVSTIIKVTKDDDGVTLECTKNKDGEEWESIRLRAIPFGDSVVLVRHDGARRPSATSRRWLAKWWETHGDEPVSITALVESRVVAKATFYDSYRELLSSHVIVKDGVGRGARYKLLADPSAASVRSESGSPGAKAPRTRTDSESDSVRESDRTPTGLRTQANAQVNDMGATQ